MSATVHYEPHRFPAGLLALAVHGMFFALLYFGFNWNRQFTLPATMSVELWAALPEEAISPPVTPKVVEVVPPPPQPQQQEKMAEPDIAVPEKKKTPPQVVEQVKPKPQKPSKQEARIAKQQAAREEAERLKQEDRAANERAERLRQEEEAAAKGRLVDEYKAKIISRIRRNIVQQADVPDGISTEFMVTLLPGGAVLKAELEKSSGNAAYDNAVERAILKSTPLPLPPDVQLFNEFRELHMTFHPEKNN
jgi:colicin import membrane protein